MYFFEKSFRVPKVVPKLIGEIVEDDKLLLYDFPMTTITAANKFNLILQFFLDSVQLSLYLLLFVWQYPLLLYLDYYK